MPEDKNLGGRPKKTQELRNRLKRARTKALEKELEIVELLLNDIHLDWDQLKQISQGIEQANSGQLKALNTRLERFWKYVEKKDIDDIINMLDDSPQASTDQESRQNKPAVIFKIKD